MNRRQPGCAGNALLILLLLAAIAALIAWATFEPANEPAEVGPAPETLAPPASVPPQRTP